MYLHCIQDHTVLPASALTVTCSNCTFLFSKYVLNAHKNCENVRRKVNLLVARHLLDHMTEAALTSREPWPRKTILFAVFRGPSTRPRETQNSVQIEWALGLWSHQRDKPDGTRSFERSPIRGGRFQSSVQVCTSCRQQNVL